MKTLKHVSAAVAIAGATLLVPAFAQQMPMDHGKMASTQAPSMTDGEIRKVDKSAGKLTIKHGEIKHMDMPPMTMVFYAGDKAMLDQVREGDKVRFLVIQESGKMTVTKIEPMR